MFEIVLLENYSSMLGNFLLQVLPLNEQQNFMHCYKNNTVSEVIDMLRQQMLSLSIRELNLQLTQH